MPVFACRWPDGDVSFVMARSEEAAVERLDELGNAEGCALYSLDEFQVHFKVTDDGQFELLDWGDETARFIWDSLYPVLREAQSNIWNQQERGKTFTEDEQQKIIRDAVHRERTRLDRTDVPEPQTELGKDLKRQSDMPTPMVDKNVRRAATERLKEFRPKGKSH